MFTRQYIETIGGGANRHEFKHRVRGDARLPVELIVDMVLLAAHEVCLDGQDERSKRLLELARVSRACHRAVLSMFLLPQLCLYGLHQIRSFAVSLDQDRVGIRALARTRVYSLTVRACSQPWMEHGYGPALFDASQAQMLFEKDLLPFVRIILSHCHALETLHLEGVPRGLQQCFAQLPNRLRAYSCLMGHYGGDLHRDFWLAQRWSNLEHLQLHGPRFRFTPNTATMLACLPKLKKLGLVVPMVVTSASSLPIESELGAQAEAVELDLSGSINPLQILIDRCSTLEAVLLVGHAEKDYVGYTEKYRHWLRSLRRRRLADASTAKVHLQLITALRPSSVASDEEFSAASRRRVHPCEVSAWIMGRAQRDLHWFDDEECGKQSRAMDGELDYWKEAFELAEHPSSSSSTAASTATTSALMSRTGSNTPSWIAAASLAQQQHTRAVDEAIHAVDMLSDDDPHASLQEIV